VRRTHAEDIVEFMGFSGSRDNLDGLLKTSRRNAEKLLQWLDDSGLAFYFLQKAKDADATGPIPDWMLSDLEKHFSANQQRMDSMWHRFKVLNQKFDAAGVRYAVLKGFSLVPDFCPQLALRHQSDFDYLVDEDSASTAQQVLRDAGYSLKPPVSDQEFVFLPPEMGEPSRGAEGYYAAGPHAVELHLDVWDSDLNRLPAVAKLFSAERATVHNWNGLEFPALMDEDAFLVQVLHTFRHLFTYWIRMSNLFEISYFLKHRASDRALWNGIEQRVGDSIVLREFVVILTELVAKLFASPIPPLVRTWGQTIRPEIRVWIENYARDCALCDLPVYEFSLLPRSKLVLFLLQQYDPFCAQKHSVRNQLIVPSRLGRIAAAVRNDPSLLLNARWWKRQHLGRRANFHVLGGLRYFCEIPRWRWRNRARLQPAPLNGDLLDRSVAGKAGTTP